MNVRKVPAMIVLVAGLAMIVLQFRSERSLPGCGRIRPSFPGRFTIP